MTIANQRFDGFPGAMPTRAIVTDCTGITRPFYGVTDLKDALQYDWNGWYLTQKMDGVWATRQFGGCIVAGESMRDGRFFAFDVPIAFGQDIRSLSVLNRNAALDELFSKLPANFNWHRVASGNGRGFINSVIDSGGEGIVAKRYDSAFGQDWFKIKPRKTFDVKVTGIIRNAIEISYLGQPAGKCPFYGAGLCIGQTVEISALYQTSSGKFREPSFIRQRSDKD